jgi:hypothetical protein
MIKRPVLYVLILLLLLTACGARSLNAPQEVTVYKEVESAAAPQPDLAYQKGDVSTGERSFDYETTPLQTERMVIFNANLSIAVDDPEASMKSVSKLAEDLGGYVVSANLYQTVLENGVKVPRASVTIRVPAEKLQIALETIKAETDQPVISENVSSQDVTSEYTDLGSRLRNLEATEQQLMVIMDRATKTEDVLSVFNQLNQVREQIELIKGQMKYYEQSAALSSISAELIPNEAVQPLTIGGWQPVGVAKNAAQALIDALKFLANAAIWIILFILPVLALVLAPPILIIRAVLIRRARRKINPPANTA